MAVHAVPEGDRSSISSASTAITRDTTTSDEFVVPSSTITNGLGGAYEYRRGGYSSSLNGAWYARSSWKPWGLADPTQPDGGLDTPQRTYVRYSANLSRDFFLGVFRKCT